MKWLKYISIYTAVKYILIKLQSQDDNHAQADDNHAKADDRKVYLYSMEQRCYERIKVYIFIYNTVKYILIKLQCQGDNHAQADDNHVKADDHRKVDLYSMEQRCYEMIEVCLYLMPKHISWSNYNLRATTTPKVTTTTPQPMQKL